VNYGDEAFPYYFFSTHASVAGILIYTVAIMSLILFLRRRWQIPFGSLTISFTFLALLWPMLSEYREAGLIPAGILAGLAGDLLLRRFAGPGAPVGRLRFFALLLPPVLWGLFFLCVELFQDGLGWHPTLWVGLLGTTAGLGFALSLLVFPPYSGPVSELVPATDESPRSPA
jgi:hypothetical protein